MSESTERRAFLQRSTAAGLLILKPETVFGSAANSTVEVGIIGCGGRGRWIADHFTNTGRAHIVAIADPFQDRLDAMQLKYPVAPGRAYKGLNGYVELVASNVDAVAIESPPYFHPEQALAAVRARKHVYLAKPVAVDAPGCATIMTAANEAKCSVSFLVDFQTRIRPVFMEAAKRVQRGDIGRPVLAHVYYHANRLQPQTRQGASAGENRLRNWCFDKALSGDIIVEQNIHVIDLANWFLEEHPVEAVGTCGRKARVDVGDASDHFVVRFAYPEGVIADFSSAQFTKGYNDLCVRIYGSRGTIDAHYGGFVKITGEHPWDGTDGGKDDTFTGGAVANVQRFLASILESDHLNNAAASVKSTLSAVLGRMAAESSQPVTWEQMLKQSPTEVHLTL
jgi:predicted dehydrogenase